MIKLNQKVSTPFGIIVIVIAAAVILGGVFIYEYFAVQKINSQLQFQDSANNQSAVWQSSAEKNCLNSGGHVKIAPCCKLTGDFSNSCLVGACGCPPAGSHQVKICDCGNGKCFDGKTCVKPTLNNI